MVEQPHMHINPFYKITFLQDENSLNDYNNDERLITDMPIGNKQLTYTESLDALHQ